MGEAEVTGEWPEGDTSEEERASPAPEPPVDPEQSLIEELSRIRDDRALVLQIAHLVRLSRDLRSRGYTGQVTLHLGNGLINSVRQEEWVNWRRPEDGHH